MSPFLSISAFTRTDATGGSRGEALPSGSCFDRRSNIVNGEKRMTDSFGHSNNFATLSLSLSLSLRYSPTIAYTLLRLVGDRASIYGFLCIRAREAA